MKKTSKKSRIGIVGLWHLGCTLSGCWTDLGHEVIGFDEDARKLEGLRKGEAPLFEPGLNDLLKKGLKSKKLSFTDRIAELGDCDYVFISYDTPVLENDESDLTPIENAIQKLKSVLKKGAVVVISSQMPAGTCLKLREILQKVDPSLELSYSPENIRLGEAMASYLNPGRVIIGVESAEAEKKTRALFGEIKADLQFMNLISSEMVKHGINSFLATSITFTNHLADLCEASGADILDVVRGIKSDPRIGKGAYLTPGIGFSGGTLGRDLKVLSHFHKKVEGAEDFFGAIYDLNQSRKKAILQKIMKIAGSSLRDKKIGILGLTYKPGTSTLRRSLPAEIVRLISDNGAQVTVYDPKADYNEWEGGKIFEPAKTMDAAVKGCEIVVLLTEWPEFLKAPWKKYYNASKPQAILDTKNFLSTLRLDKIGFGYHGIGRN